MTWGGGIGNAQALRVLVLGYWAATNSSADAGTLRAQNFLWSTLGAGAAWPRTWTWAARASSWRVFARVLLASVGTEAVTSRWRANAARYVSGNATSTIVSSASPTANSARRRS